VTVVQLVPASEDVASGRGWAELVDAYLTTYCESPKTRKTWRHMLCEAFTWLGVDRVEEVTGLRLGQYRAWVMDQRWAPQTKSGRIVALRSFLKWSRMLGAHEVSRDMVEWVLRIPRSTTLTPYVALTQAEVARLLAAASSPRDRTALAIMVGAGLRASEVLALRVSDFRDGEVPFILVRQGKGGKDRVVPIGEGLAAILRDQTAGHPPDSRVIPLEYGRLRAIVAQTARRAGLTARVTPHALRHTYATMALKTGRASVMHVSKLLGHTSIATTQRYVDHLGIADLAAAAPDLPPPADPPSTGWATERVALPRRRSSSAAQQSRTRRRRRPQLSPEATAILERVTGHYGVALDEIFSPRQDRRTVWPRQVAMSLIRETTALSLPAIGRAFNRDHSTVLHACEKIARLSREDVSLQLQLRELAASAAAQRNAGGRGR
jgi:integrase